MNRELGNEMRMNIFLEESDVDDVRQDEKKKKKKMADTHNYIAACCMEHVIQACIWNIRTFFSRSTHTDNIRTEELIQRWIGTGKERDTDTQFASWWVRKKK